MWKQKFVAIFSLVDFICEFGKNQSAISITHVAYGSCIGLLITFIITQTQGIYSFIDSLVTFWADITGVHAVHASVEPGLTSVGVGGVEWAL